MTKIIIALLVFVCGLDVNAQWAAVNSGTVNNLMGLQMVSATTGYMAATDGLYATNNGGLNWNKLHYFQADSTFYITVGVYSLYFTNSITGVAVGFSYVDNAAVIIRTTNGGTQWATSYVGEPDITFNDVCFVNANTGFAVGENGTIVTTTDGGNSWNPVTSGVTNDLKKIRFDPGNTNYGLICGDSIMLRTTNGGISWARINFASQALRTVNFAAPGIAYSTSNYYALLKTTDDGATWDSVTTTMPGAADIFFTSQDTGYTCSDEIYRTLDGGGVCDQQIPLSGNNFLYFYNSQLGFCGGYGGELFRTANAGGNGWKPIAQIILNGSYTCTDSLYHFQTISNPNYTYRWTLNGRLLSTQAMDSAIMHGNNTNDTLMVVVSNGVAVDTATTVFYAFGPSGFRLLPLFATDTTCNGGFGYIGTDSSCTCAYYQLFADTLPVGDFLEGTGGNMFFSITGYGTNIFTVKAYDFAGCTQAPLVQTITVIPNPPPVPVFTAAPPAICWGDTLKIEVQNTEYGATYNLIAPQYSGNLAVGIGTGGTIYLTSYNAIFTTDSFGVQTISRLGCTNFYPDVAKVVVRKLNVGFTRTEAVLVGQNIQIQNISNGDHYYWTFDSSANVLTDTSFQPSPVYYNTTGVKVAKLKVTTDVAGCVDTISFRERVSLPIDTQAPGQVCALDTVYSFNTNIWQTPANTLVYHVDRFGNQYVAGFTNSSENGGYNYNSYYYYLQKFDRNNNLIWQKTQSPSTYDTIGDGGQSYYSGYITGVTTDPIGNVYVCGTYGTHDFVFDTVHIHAQSTVPRFYIAKLDTLGKLQWLVHSSNDADNGFYSGASDILYVDAMHIYVPVFSSMITDSVIGPDGVPYNSRFGSAFLLQINSDGKFVQQFGIQNLYGLTNNNVGPYNPYHGELDFGWVTTVSPKLYLGNNGNVILSGQFVDRLVFGNSAIYDTLDYGIDGYIATLDTASGWKGAFSTYEASYEGVNVESVSSEPIIPVSCVDKSGNVYVIANTPFRLPYQDGEILTGADPYLDSLPASYILKYNSTGKLLWIEGTYQDGVKGIAVNDNSDTVYLFGSYQPFFSVDSLKNTLPVGRASMGQSDDFIAALDSSGNFGWFQNIGSDTIDGALFMARNCGGVLNCLGYTAGPAALKNVALSNNLFRNFILHYDPTGQNCQPQVCPAAMSIYHTVYDTILNSDTVYASNHTFTQNNITLYGDSNSIDSVSIIDTVISNVAVTRVDTVYYSSSYQSYDTALAITYTYNFDTVVYYDTTVIQVDTLYTDTLIITKTIKQTTGIAGTASNGLKLSVYPNPFNSTTNVNYYLPEDAQVTIVLYDNLGRKVKSLFDGEQSSGNYNFAVSATGLSAGVYQLAFTSGDKIIMQKIVYLNKE